MKNVSTNPDEKYCPRCKQFKHHNDFSNNRTKKDGKASHCKVCNINTQANYKKRSSNKYRFSIYQRPTDAMQIVGINRKEYEKIWVEQCGRCAICGKEETAKHQSGKIKRLAVDHDHKTGQFRGLLCYRCNLKLHTLEDESFTSAARAYLQRNHSTLPE